MGILQAIWDQLFNHKSRKRLQRVAGELGVKWYWRQSNRLIYRNILDFISLGVLLEHINSTAPDNWPNEDLN